MNYRGHTIEKIGEQYEIKRHTAHLWFADSLNEAVEMVDEWADEMDPNGVDPEFTPKAG